MSRRTEPIIAIIGISLIIIFFSVIISSAAEIECLPPVCDCEDGKDGKDGVNGKDGKDGVDGTNGLNGNDGENGSSGGSSACCKILLAYTLDGEPYPYQNHCAVPRRGDIVLYSDGAIGFVTAVKWDARDKQVFISTASKTPDNIDTLSSINENGEGLSGAGWDGCFLQSIFE